MSVRRAVLLLSALVLVLVPAPPRAQAMAVREAGRRWALIVSSGGAGRTHAQALARVLTASYGFESEAALVVYQDEADLGRITEAMKLLAARFRPYDALFIYLGLPRRDDAALTTGDFFLIPAKSRADAPWTWVSGKTFFQWLEPLPVSQALVIYPSCGDKSDDHLLGELAYGKRTGVIDLLRICDSGSARQRADSPDQRRAAVTRALAEALRAAAERREPLSTALLTATLQQSVEALRIDTRRVPEWERRALSWDPVSRSVEGERASYRRASAAGDREDALRNLPALVKASPAADREGRAAAAFLREVAVSANAGVDGPLPDKDRVTLRKAAVEVLGDLRTDDARDALCELARRVDDDVIVRREAVAQLARAAPPRPADLQALRAALADPHPSVREGAVRAMVVLKDVGAAGDLRALLRSEADPTVRIAVIQALSTLGGDDRAPMIELLQDQDPSVRREAASALGRLGRSPEASAALVARLANDDADEVRAQAAYALARTAGGGAATPSAVNALVAALHRGPEKVRVAAAHGLGSLGGDGGEDALRALLNAGESEAERVAAAEALGQIKSVAALSDLRAAARDAERPGLRRAAVAALGAIGTRAVFEPLLLALEDIDPFVRAQAQKSLERLPVTTADVLPLLTHASGLVRQEAVQRLGAQGDPDALPGLVQALGDPVAEVRFAAATALAGYRGPAAIQAVVGATRSPDRTRQFAAFTALGAMHDEAALPALLDVLRETKDAAARAEVLDWIGRRVEGRPAGAPGVDAARAVLLEASREASDPVRQATVRGLAAFEAGRQRLQEMARADTSRDVRASASEQLRKSGVK